jgi:hypothetical protein
MFPDHHQSIIVNKNDDGCAKAIPLHLAFGREVIV